METETLDFLSIVIDLSKILVPLIVAGYIAFFVRRKYYSLVELRISERWLEGTSNVAIFKIEIINRSKVIIMKQRVLFQALEYAVPSNSELTEFLPFRTEQIETYGLPEPLSWSEPQEIVKTTTHLIPGEHIIVERVKVFTGGPIIQFGVQFYAKLSWWERILNRSPFKRTERWTTTGWSEPPVSKGTA